MAESAGQQFAKLPASSKVIVLAILLVALGVGYYTVFHSSISDQLDGAAATKSQLEQDLAAAKSLQLQFVKLREEVEARKVIDQQNMRVLPRDPEIATMLAELNRIAELSGLSIQAVEPKPETGGEFY